MLSIGALFGLLTAWMEAHTVGATGKEWDLGLQGRFVIAGRAFWFYLGKLIWPHPLVFVYPRWSGDELSGGALLFPLTAVSFLFLLWGMRTRIGRGPLAAFLLYCGTLAPALGFINTYPMRFSFVADHFAYLATIGPLALLAAFVATQLGRLDRPALVARRLPAGLLAVALAILGSLTWNQARIYRNEETLWRDTLGKNPDAFIANNNLGGILLERGDLEQAEQRFEAAVRSKGDFPDALDNLGIVRQRQGRLGEAESYYREALEHDPTFADAHNNLGIVLATKGAVAEAIDHFSQAVRLRRSFANAHSNLGLALESVGRTAEAVPEYREALRYAPNSTDVATRLAFILATHPDARLRDGREAVRLAETVCHPTSCRDASALDVLAAAYAESGRFDDAVRTAERALEVDPSNPESAPRRERDYRLELYRSGRPFRR
jgi:tetratricopeptide (TPR) repeat protein